MGLFSSAQKKALESSPVRVAFDTFVRNQTLKNRHDLETALVAAGIVSRIERTKLISNMLRTRKYGDA